MIEKEKLEELIKQDATIYRCYADVGVYELRLKNVRVDTAHLWVNGRIGIPLDSLFETKEDAEFALKYQDITRTETLNLPTWEEAQDERFYYIKNFESLTGIHFFISIYKFTNDFEIYCSHGSKIGDYHIERHFDLRNKKQYLEACELCRKLFLGETE